MKDTIPGVVVIDKFLPDFTKTRTHAINSEYFDWLAPDGQVYKRISLLHVPGLLVSLENNLGAIRILMAGYRLNYADEPPNQSIHSDLGFGSHAVVVFLNEGDSGTAFWKHKETGATEINFGDADLFNVVKLDWDNPDAWEQVEYVAAKENRAVIYKGNLFHSRFPFKAFGDTPENGRLIATAFFNFISDLPVKSDD